MGLQGVLRIWPAVLALLSMLENGRRPHIKARAMVFCFRGKRRASLLALCNRATNHPINPSLSLFPIPQCLTVRQRSSPLLDLALFRSGMIIFFFFFFFFSKIT